jgi:multiple sugar transport system ATP-binding protein
MAEVKLVNINKVYEAGYKAVNDLSIEIKDKEFLVLVGPSGCGKSTTLRMIAGLEDITSGELYINGKLVNNISPKDRDIAMVFQNYALYPHMTVYENMAFGLKLRKFPKEEIKNRVMEAANVLELEEFLNRKPKALSGGQRQRVALGRAIVRKPKVFLFDEPLSNLDAKLRVQMRTEISKLHKRFDATIIYVTHDQIEAMTMGDRIVVMKDGNVQQIDSPLTLYNRPQNKFVAGFIGSPSMNFLKGKVTPNDNLKFVNEKKALRFCFNDEQKNRLSNHIGKEIWIGIRPEDILDSITKLDDKNYIAVTATLEVVEPMGNEIFLYFNLEGNQFISRIPARQKPNPKEDFTFYFDIAKLHFFDNETERRIE